MAEEAIKNAKKLDIRELMGHFEKIVTVVKVVVSDEPSFFLS